MRQTHTIRGALALSAVAAVLSFAAPAQAQQASCTPGSLGEGGEYRVNNGEDNKVTAATIEYQCAETLADGTFAPEGYRVILKGECGSGACNYPTLIAHATARPGIFQAGFVQDGKNVNVTLRAPRNNNNGVLTLAMVSRAPEKGAKPERARYRLRGR